MSTKRHAFPLCASLAEKGDLKALGIVVSVKKGDWQRCLRQCYYELQVPFQVARTAPVEENFCTCIAPACVLSTAYRLSWLSSAMLGTSTIPAFHKSKTARTFPVARSILNRPGYLAVPIR